MSLRETLSKYWYAFQQEPFPRLEMEFAPLSGRYELFVAVVEFVRLETPAAPPKRGKVALDGRIGSVANRFRPEKTCRRTCRAIGVAACDSDNAFCAGIMGSGCSGGLW